MFTLSYILFCQHMRSTRVLYVSDHFVIVDKPADLKINSNQHSETTVQTFLKAHFPYLANEKLFHEFYFPHRLDYATSGILCIPKTKETCQAVSESFMSRKVRKYYIAIVRGWFSELILDIRHAIGEDLHEQHIQKMCTIKEDGHKYRASRTILTVLEEGIYDNYPATKILCRPVTGRRHQIRVHCSSIGHTIVGDYTYSNRKDWKPRRMFLHAERLVIPWTIEEIDISTGDPFKQVKGWKSTKMVQSLTVAYRRVDSHLDPE